MMRMSKKECVERLNIKYNNFYDYSETEFNGLKLLIEPKCPIHGKFSVLLASHLYNSKGCQKCAEEQLKNKYIEVVNIKYNNFYDYSEINLKGVESFIDIKCPIHGKFSILASNHLYHNIGCQECKLLLRDINSLSKANEVHNHKYDYSLSKFGNTYDKIDIICPIHKNIFSQILGNHLNGQGCPLCGRESYSISSEEANNRLIGRNIKFKSKYVNSHIKSIFECEICKHEWSVEPSSIFGGRGCPKCSLKNRWTSNGNMDNFLIGKDIERTENCTNFRTKMGFHCLKENCGCFWRTTPKTIKNGRGCPLCATGKSEKCIFKLIKEIIKYENIEVHKYIKINNKKYIPDFYLSIDNRILIIEYNGHQHYRPVRFNGKSQEKADKCFEKQKIRDEILRNYCKENNIYLLEIPYYWKEEQIINELKKLNNL